MRSQVQKQVSDAVKKLEGKLIPKGPGITRYLTLPKEGWSEAQVRAELQKAAEMEHTRWEDGLVSGAVYHGGDGLIHPEQPVSRLAVGRNQFSWPVSAPVKRLVWNEE